MKYQQQKHTNWHQATQDTAASAATPPTLTVNTAISSSSSSPTLITFLMHTWQAALTDYRPTGYLQAHDCRNLFHLPVTVQVKRLWLLQQQQHEVTNEVILTVKHVIITTSTRLTGLRLTLLLTSHSTTHDYNSLCYSHHQHQTHRTTTQSVTHITLH